MGSTGLLFWGSGRKFCLLDQIGKGQFGFGLSHSNVEVPIRLNGVGPGSLTSGDNIGIFSDSQHVSSV